MDLAQLKTLKNVTLTVPGISGLELYPFQRLGVAALQSTPRIILGDFVGLGKTVQSVAAIQLLHNTEELSRNDCLVVAPKAVRSDWFKTIKNFTTLTPLIGDESDKECKYLSRKWNVLILGFPTMRIRIENLLKTNFKMIIIDEGLFRNAESQTFIALKRLTDKAQRVVILNATSMEVSLMEVYSHIEIICPGLIDLQSFKDKFCKVETKYFRTIYHTLKTQEKIVGPKSLEAIKELKDFMNKFYLRRTYDDVSVQLPSKVIKNIRVELLPCQKKEYTEQLKKYKNKEIRGSELCYNLLKICDGKLEGFEKEENPEKVSAKGQAFVSYLDSVGKQPVVVYSTYISQLLAFAKIAKNMGRRIGFFSGENEKTRDQHLEEFKEGKRDVLMLTRAGTRGINLENSARLVLVNQLFNSAATTQLIGRISRMTSKHKTIFIDNLLTVDTIEDNVLNLLEQRGITADFINEDGTGFKSLTDDQVNKMLRGRKSLIEGLA